MPTPLSRYLTVEKFTKSDTAKRNGIPNNIDPKHMENAKSTAAWYDFICDKLDRMVDLNGAYRSKLLNSAIPNASATSYHCFALAMDLDDDLSPPHEQVSDYDLAVAIAAIPDLPYDKVILEYGWVHVQFAKPGEKPRRQTFTIKGPGKPAIPGLVK